MTEVSGRDGKPMKNAGEPSREDRANDNECEYDPAEEEPRDRSVDTRFKDGNPGGPGRPKGSKNVATLVNDVLNSKVAMKVNGKTKKKTRFEVAIYQLIKKATEGDLKAIAMVIQLRERYGPVDDGSEILPEQTAYDLKTLIHHLHMQGLLDDDEEDDDGVAA